MNDRMIKCFCASFVFFYLRKIIQSRKKKKKLQYRTTWDSTVCTVHPTVSYNKFMRDTVHEQ